MKIVIVSGTNRPGARTRVVADVVAALHRDNGHDVDLLDLAELPTELFQPEAYAVKPAAFARFSEGVLAADGLVVVSPEYNGGPPGVLKYFIDMLPFPESFEHRPTCFVGLAAGAWGALRPIEQLQAIFAYRNAHIYPRRVFIPRVAGVLDGDELTDEALRARLAEQAAGFGEFVARLRG